MLIFLLFILQTIATGGLAAYEKFDRSIESVRAPAVKEERLELQYVLTNEKRITLSKRGSLLQSGDLVLPIVPRASLAVNSDPICVHHFNTVLRSFLQKYNPEAIERFEDCLLRPLPEKILPNGFEIKFVSDSVGYGVFTTRDIEAGQIIGEYAGVLSLWTLIHPDCRYSITCGPKNLGFSDFVICACQGNFTRFINHSLPENCNINTITYYNQNGPHLMFETTKQIKKGEQILYNYGPEYWKRLKLDPEKLF